MVILQVEGMESELDTLEKKREKAQQGKSMIGIMYHIRKTTSAIEYLIHNRKYIVYILKHQMKSKISKKFDFRNDFKSHPPD